MNQITLEEFNAYKKILEKYESIGINVEEEKTKLEKLEEKIASTKTRQIFLTKEEKTLKEEIKEFLSSLKEKEHYYYIIITTKYINGIIGQTENIEESIKYVIDCLKRIDECNIEKIKKEKQMLTNFYQMVLGAIELELLYGKNITYTILDYITSSENKIHLEYMEQAIKKRIEEVKKETYADINSIHNLENSINKKMLQGPLETLVDKEIIKHLIACTNYGKLIEILKESITNYKVDLQDINNKIKELENNFNFYYNDIQTGKSHKKYNKILITKIVAALLGLLTPISIIYFKNANKVVEFMSTVIGETLYETTITTYSKNDKENEAYQNAITSVTWEQSYSKSASRTLEVLGEVRIESGELKRDYKIYDISEYGYNLDLQEYLKMYEEGEITDKKIIKEGTRTATVEEYKYSDIIIEEVIQNRNKTKKETSKETIKLVENISIGIVIAVDLIIVLYSMSKIISKIKEILKSSKDIKETTQMLKEKNNNIMELLTTNASYIEKYKELCKNLSELLNDSKLSKGLLEELEVFEEQDKNFRKSLKLK
ncbi:MAG: hypothetical protein HFE04_02325 [Bacilli bacterium]|nr:hypothetical protein [Bacilli bacterium]